jgi:hypothetical protein
MPLPRGPLIISAATAVAIGLYVEHRIRDLERRYPITPIPPSNLALLSPPPGHTAHDAFLITARSSPVTLDTWTRTFLSTPTLVLESRFFGSEPPDVGSNGFHSGQQLLNGIFNVVRVPSDDEGLLVDWELPDSTVRFFEKLARWKYPWRLMTGGRHEWMVKYTEKMEITEVGWGSVHFYREFGDGRTIPEWTKRLHRAYARYLVDAAVMKMERERVVRMFGGRQW